MRDRKGVDLDGKGCGEKLGEVEGGKKIMIRIYYVRKTSIFNKRKKYWSPMSLNFTVFQSHWGEFTPFPFETG